MNHQPELSILLHNLRVANSFKMHHDYPADKIENVVEVTGWFLINQHQPTNTNFPDYASVGFPWKYNHSCPSFQ